jgi:hypothetical protein
MTCGGVNARVFGAKTASMWWFGELSNANFTDGKSLLYGIMATFLTAFNLLFAAVEAR